MHGKRKYLIVKGVAGLGNRLCTLCSAIDYARKTNRTLIVDWSDGLYGVKGDNVFHRFFLLKGIDSVPSISDIPDFEALKSYPPGWKKDPELGIYDVFDKMDPTGLSRIPYRFLLHERLKMNHGYWFKRDTLSGVSDSTLIKDHSLSPPLFYKIKGIWNKENFPFGRMLNLNHKEDIVYYVDVESKMAKNILLEHVELRPHIRSQIDAFAKKEQLGDRAIGVHVRYTDRKPQRSIDLLIDKVKEIRAAYDVPRIFLATDNPDVTDLFTSVFGEIVEYPKLRPNLKDTSLHWWARLNGQESLAQQIFEESVMDMWLLSKCRYLIYQGNSSFSKISAMLHTYTQRVMAWS